MRPDRSRLDVISRHFSCGARDPNALGRQETCHLPPPRRVASRLIVVEGVGMGLGWFDEEGGAEGRRGGSGAAVAAAGRHFRLQRSSHFVLPSGFPSVCRDPPRDAFGFPLGSRVTYEHARKRMRCTRARGARPREQRQPGRRRFDKQYDMLASCNFQVRLFVPLFPTFPRPPRTAASCQLFLSLSKQQ